MCVGVVAMSSAALFIRLAQADGAPSLVIAAYRLTTATIVLTLPVIAKGTWRELLRLTCKEKYALLLSGILLGFHFASWISSLEHTSVVNSLVLVSTTPLWLGIISPIFLKEQTSRKTWIGIGLAIAGGLLIARASAGVSMQATMRGNLLALTGAVFMAGYLLIGRSVRSRLALLTYLWAVYGTAALLLVGLAVFSRLQMIGYSTQTVIWMIALGLIPQLVGHSSANYAVRHVSATLVAIIILGEPIGSSLLATMFLNEWPHPLQVVGGAIILAGISLAAISDSHDTKESVPVP